MPVLNIPPTGWSPPGYEIPHTTFPIPVQMPEYRTPQIVFQPNHCCRPYPIAPPWEEDESEIIPPQPTEVQDKIPSHKIPILEKYPWQETVKTKKLSIPPTVLSEGDRFLIINGNSIWSENTNKIAYYNGCEWKYDCPLPGWVVYIEDEDEFYKYDGNHWKIISTQHESASSDLTLLEARIQALESALENVIHNNLNIIYDSDLKNLLVTL